MNIVTYHEAVDENLDDSVHVKLLYFEIREDFKFLSKQRKQCFL